MRHTARAAVFAVGLLLPVPAFAAAVQYKGPVTLDNGQTQTTTIDVTSSTPLPVTVSGGGSNAAASATGSAVPSSAGYNGLNVGGTLRGQTGANPTGSVYAGQTDLTSVNGVTALTGAGATGTGSPRTTQAQDTTTIAGAAPLTTGVYVTGPSAAALATAANQASVIGTKSPGTAAASSQLIGGVYNSSDPTLTNGQQASAQMTAKGEVRNHDTDLLAAAQAGTTTTGSAAPASAVYMGANSAGNLTGVIQADQSAKIDISTATTTQLVALSSGKKIYVTNYKVIAGGTGNFKFVYGTGSNCGTGTTDLEGANPLTAQAGSSDGGGLGAILFVPASNALCATTSAAVQMSGHVSYTQF